MESGKNSKSWKNISIYICRFKIKFQSLTLFTEAITNIIQFKLVTHKIQNWLDLTWRVSRLLAIRKIIKNHVLFHYTECLEKIDFKVLELSTWHGLRYSQKCYCGEHCLSLLFSRAFTYFESSTSKWEVSNAPPNSKPY